MVPILRPAFAGVRIATELRMHFRRERKNAPTLSLQETLDAGKEDSALTLADVLQDGFCREDSCEKQDDAQRLRVDDWELDPKVQDAVAELWPQVTTENYSQLTDYAGYNADFLRLFGFGLAGVDYEADISPQAELPLA